MIHATRAWTSKTGQKAADLAMPVGRKRSTGAAPDAGHPTQQADARGDVHANHAAWLCSWLKPSLRVLRGLSQCPLPGDVECWPCLRHVHQLTAWEQAERSWDAACDPSMARKATKGECVPYWDHFDLLQSARN